MRILRLAWSSYQEPALEQTEARPLRERGHDYTRATSYGEVPPDLASYDAVLITSHFAADAAFLAQLRPGTLLVTTTSGHDHIDLEAAEERGVPVARTPEARAHYVRRHTRAQLLALRRDLPSADRDVKNNDWDRHRSFRRMAARSGNRAGVVGYGVIGRGVCDTLAELDTETIQVADPLEREAIEANPELRYRPLDELLAAVDLLTIHVDHNPSTDPLLDLADLMRMQEGSILVNNARGACVDPLAVHRAIVDGPLEGAALDVFPQEPPDAEAWRDCDRLLVTPHTAGLGPRINERLGRELLATISAFALGDALPHPVRARSPEQKARLRAARGGSPPGP